MHWLGVGQLEKDKEAFEYSRYMRSIIVDECASVLNFMATTSALIYIFSRYQTIDRLYLCKEQVVEKA